MKTQNLTEIDLSILKYYKQGRELSGFEGVHKNLRNIGFLNSDLELTSDARKYMRENEALFENVIPYNNKMYISIK